MKKLYALKDMLCDELKGYADKGKFDMQSLEVVDKLAHALKNIDKVIENYEADEAMYSNYYSNGTVRIPPMNMSYADSNMSYGRGPYAKRDSMGRYASAGYSRHGDFRADFQELLNEAPNDRIRQKMMEVINEM